MLIFSCAQEQNGRIHVAELKNCGDVACDNGFVRRLELLVMT